MICYFLIVTALAIMIADPNVIRYIDLFSKLVSINIELFLWKITFHPMNPFAAVMLERKMNKLIEKIQKELELLDNKL